MKYKMTVEKFLTAGNLFVDGDSYINKYGEIIVVGVDMSAAVANIKHNDDDRRFVISAKCLEEKEMSEYVKIENPDIFALKDDFESGKLYRKHVISGHFVNIVRLCGLADSVKENNIYRKARWIDKLDGTEENGVLCEVWDSSRNLNAANLVKVLIYTGIFFKDTEDIPWKNAEPVPQEMVDFINRK